MDKATSRCHRAENASASRGGFPDCKQLTSCDSGRSSSAHSIHRSAGRRGQVRDCTWPSRAPEWQGGGSQCGGLQGKLRAGYLLSFRGVMQVLELPLNVSKQSSWPHSTDAAEMPCTPSTGQSCGALGCVLRKRPQAAKMHWQALALCNGEGAASPPDMAEILLLASASRFCSMVRPQQALTLMTQRQHWHCLVLQTSDNDQISQLVP